MLAIGEILDMLHRMQEEHEASRSFSGTASGFHEGYSQALIDVSEWFYGILEMDEPLEEGDYNEEEI